MRVLLLMLLSGSINAENVWTDDGSLIIVDAPDTVVYIDDTGTVNYQAEISNEETTLVYGNESLTVCMPTIDGSICY